MTNKLTAVRWFELPLGRADIDHVRELLEGWAEWADFGREEIEKNDLRILFLNSALHVIECALILRLLLFREKLRKAASSRRRDDPGPLDANIFHDANELFQACTSGEFQNGYPLELAEALLTCYAFEAPWDLPPVVARTFAADLTNKLKDIALYGLESLENWGNQMQREHAKVAAENAKSKAELTVIHSGAELRTDAKDKRKFIAWVKENNIEVDNVSVLLDRYKSTWPLTNNYSDKTLKDWYKEAMPHVELRRGRPRKK